MRAIIFFLAVIFSFRCYAATEALEEVNAKREERGLQKFIEDKSLTKAAKSCADFRAERLISGHTSNDFNAVPTGAKADAAGCAAWPPSMGWGSCCAYEHWKFAGAAWAMGRDGKRYMHLFVREGDGGGSGFWRGRRGRR
jgi:hypothetical protein